MLCPHEERHRQAALLQRFFAAAARRSLLLLLRPVVALSAMLQSYGQVSLSQRHIRTRLPARCTTSELTLGPDEGLPSTDAGRCKKGPRL